MSDLGTQASAGPYVLLSFAAYLIVVIVIGVYASRFSSAGLTEFFVGGRKMNRFVVALSAVVSGRSAWLLLGLTGMAYSLGASALWAAAGYILVELFLFLFYARRLRLFSEHYDCITLPDFFESRFADSRGRIRILLVVIFIIFMVSYVSAQFVAGGKAFSASFQIDPMLGVVITAAVVLLYTMFGGFLAVSLTDTFQASLMLLALVILPGIAITETGGWTAVMHELAQIDATLVDPTALSFGALIGFLGIGLGSPGNPHILVRYMSIDDPDQFRFTAIVGTFWNVVMAAGAILIGLAGRAYFPDADLLPGSDTENLYPLMAQQHLHPVLFGVVLASIFAAIMSTADSQLLVAASSLVRDLYQKVLSRDVTVTQKSLVLYSRVVILIIVLISVVFGLLASDLVFWLVLFAWAGLGAALGPISILALFWKRTTAAGVICGLLTGTIVTIVWNRVPFLKSFVYELVPAFLLALLVTVGVSLFSKPPEDTEAMFAKMAQKE